MNQIPDAAVKLIQDFEGCRLTAYQDQRGIWTIGYGHTGAVYPGQTISQEEAARLLSSDISKTCRAVEACVTVPINDNQFGALVSLAYNIGMGNFVKSTLLEKLENRDYVGASEQFLVWDKLHTSEGVITDIGLLRRRKAEQALFNKPVTKVFA